DQREVLGIARPGAGLRRQLPGRPGRPARGRRDRAAGPGASGAFLVAAGRRPVARAAAPCRAARRAVGRRGAGSGAQLPVGRYGADVLGADPRAALRPGRVARGSRHAMSGWKFVRHVPTRRSYDSMTDPARLVQFAVDFGIDVLAVTDHDTWQGSVDVYKHAY